MNIEIRIVADTNTEADSSRQLRELLLGICNALGGDSGAFQTAVPGMYVRGTPDVADVDSVSPHARVVSVSPVAPVVPKVDPPAAPKPVTITPPDSVTTVVPVSKSDALDFTSTPWLSSVRTPQEMAAALLSNREAAEEFLRTKPNWSQVLGVLLGMLPDAASDHARDVLGCANARTVKPKIFEIAEGLVAASSSKSSTVVPAVDAVVTVPDENITGDTVDESQPSRASLIAELSHLSGSSIAEIDAFYTGKPVSEILDQVEVYRQSVLSRESDAVSDAEYVDEPSGASDDAVREGAIGTIEAFTMAAGGKPIDNAARAVFDSMSTEALLAEVARLEASASVEVSDTTDMDSILALHPVDLGLPVADASGQPTRDVAPFFVALSDIFRSCGGLQAAKSYCARWASELPPAVRGLVSHGGSPLDMMFRVHGKLTA